MIRIGADEEFYPHTHTYTWQPTRRATKAAGLSKEGSDLRLKGKAQRSGAFRVQRVEQSKAERKPRRVLSEAMTLSRRVAEAGAAGITAPWGSGQGRVPAQTNPDSPDRFTVWTNSKIPSRYP